MLPSRPFSKGLSIMLYSSIAFLSANSPNTGLTKSADKKLTIAISQEFANLNPAIIEMQASSYLVNFAYRDLAYIDRNTELSASSLTMIPSLENGLAEFYQDKGQRKLKATWEFRPEAKWGDGTPVTAADFVFGHEVGMTNTVSIPNRSLYTNIEKIEVDPKNPKKFTTYFKEPRWDFARRVSTIRPLPAHLERPIFEKFKNVNQGYEKNTQYVTNPTLLGLWNGPFTVKELKLGSHITFARNERYWGKPAQIDQITVKLIPNTATMEANLRSGTVDMLSNFGLKFDQALAFNKKVQNEKLPYKVAFVPGLVYEHIDLNLDNPILKNRSVRQALVYGINREDLVNALFEGKQPVALHNVAPTDKEWFTADANDIKLYKPRARKARKLLEKAGWKKDPSKGDEYRYKDGQKLSLQFMTTAADKTRELVQTYLKDQWKNIGVEVIIKNEPARVYFGETTKKRKYEALAMYAWVRQPQTSPRQTMHSSSIPTAANGWSGSNYPGWANKEVDRVIEELEKEFSPPKRIALIRQFLGLYTSEVPAIPLYYRSNISVTPTYLKGYELFGHLTPSSAYVEEWYIDRRVAAKK